MSLRLQDRPAMESGHGQPRMLPLWVTLVGVAASTAVPALALEGLWRLGGEAPLLGGSAARVLGVLGVSALAAWVQPYRVGQRWVWPWTMILPALVAGAAAAVYAANQSVVAGALLVAMLYVFALGLAGVLAQGRGTLRRMVSAALVGAGASLVLTAAVQVEIGFAEEEFFAGLQALLLSVVGSLLLVGWEQTWGRLGLARRRGLGLAPRTVCVSLALALFAGLVVTVRAYQNSFYPSQAPTFAGITPSDPFLCGTVEADSATYAGEEVFRQLLSRLADGPDQGGPMYGALAVGTTEPVWAQRFRAALLQEAAQRALLDPSNSVKYSQYQAARRVYYFARVAEAFPDLFSEPDSATIKAWFMAINRRALEVEWVDGLYALAFAKWPEGPYENQEIGPGLLAILEAEGLADPALSERNRKYLDRSPRGWEARFRNTDDSFAYQLVWLETALMQAHYEPDASSADQRGSFEWLLLQALPDGAPLRYNYSANVSAAAGFYLGAQLLEDPRYVWLAGRTLEQPALDGILPVWLGVDEATGMAGVSPEAGSCLLYGDSGTPTRVGPLAPDKIVMRDGWDREAAYALLNLRFTGWHRYKATNALISVYQAGPLIVEETSGEEAGWLPMGRRQFRDKRLPRENLNGLVIERTGLDAVLHWLTGMGGPWAQDVPHYASVDAFETGTELDFSQTRLEDWHGWSHRRQLYAYHQGPLIVVDVARGPSGTQAALLWHVATDNPGALPRLQIRGGDDPAEMVLVSLTTEPTITITAGVSSRTSVVTAETRMGELALATIFLTREWVGAQVAVQPGQPSVLQIVQGEQELLVSLADFVE